MFKIVFLFGLLLVAVMAQDPENPPQPPPMQGPRPGHVQSRIVRQANMPMPPNGGGFPNPGDMMSGATHIMQQGKEMAENAMGKMASMAGGGRQRRHV